jgi:hypothetical protein
MHCVETEYEVYYFLEKVNLIVGFWSRTVLNLGD